MQRERKHRGFELDLSKFFKHQVEIKINAHAVRGRLICIERSGNIILEDKGNLIIVRKRAILSMGLRKIKLGAPFVEPEIVFVQKDVMNL